VKRKGKIPYFGCSGNEPAPDAPLFSLSPCQKIGFSGKAKDFSDRGNEFSGKAKEKIGKAEEKTSRAEEKIGKADEKISRAEDFLGLFFLPPCLGKHFFGKA